MALTHPLLLAAGAVLTLPHGLPAEETRRSFCDPGDHRGGKCVDDTLEVVFPGFGGGQSTAILDTFVPDQALEMHVVLDTVTSDLAGWSFGVAHDAAHLELESATIVGTDAELALNPQGSFEVTSVVEGGLIQAVVLSLKTRRALPVGRNSLLRANYRWRGDPGETGTRIEFSEELHPPLSPNTRISVVDQAAWEPGLPRTLIDGLIRVRAPHLLFREEGGDPVREDAPRLFLRGDGDASGEVDLADAVAILGFLFLGAPARLSCSAAADTDGDGRLGINDPLLLLDHWFLGTAPPQTIECAPAEAYSTSLDCSDPGPACRA
jgi:hypothetical protein